MAVVRSCAKIFFSQCRPISVLVAKAMAPKIVASV